MNKIIKWFANPGNSQGSVLVLTAFLLMVFLGVAALAIDIGYLSTTRNELQNTADAAALAAAGYLGNEYVILPVAEQATRQFTRTEIETVVQDVATSNKASGIGVQILPSDIVIAQWVPATESMTTENLDVTSETYVPPDAVYVKARRDNTQNSPISTFFAGLFGIDTMSVTAEAVASLSGPGIMAQGELITPFGLSERLFPSDCKDTIAFSPTPSSCAGWHNFFDPKDANALEGKMYGLILSDACDEHCDESNGLVDGATWMTNNFNINTNYDPANKLLIPTPKATVGDEFIYIGGDAATLFNGEYLFEDYNGNFGTPYKNDSPVAVNMAKNPAPFVALFDYFRYRDGDADYIDPVTGKEWDADEIWSATVPVYKDDANVDCLSTGSNPVNAMEIVDFAKIRIFRPNPPPSTNIDVKVDCDFSVVDGRSGGGTSSNIRGAIPNLVK